MRISTLDVPGASLYYEVRGAGPVLLLICGGVYDAAAYAPLANQLSDTYTVVTYDRRGNSRSRIDGPPRPQQIETHAEDAARVLWEVGVDAARPAYVFGNSSGATIAVALASRHPDLVRAVVAHEPPLFSLLPDRDRLYELLDRVEASFATQGAEAAMAEFSAGLAGGQEAAGADQSERMPGGDEVPPGEPPPEVAEMMARMSANLPFFIGYEVPSFSRYEPDLDAVAGTDVVVVPAAGVDSVGEPPHRGALALAERLGVPAVQFPGDHGGFGTDPAAFAQAIRAELGKPPEP